MYSFDPESFQQKPHFGNDNRNAMADSSSERSNTMKESNRESPSEICDDSQSNKDELEPGYIEDRFRVDRKKLEQMLQGNLEQDDESAEEFFQRIMEESNTQITWPSKLKIGAKSKKDPHIKVIGYPEDVKNAKDRIMSILDTKSNRVTLKMDVSHTDHSHVIGKGGNNIKRVMQQTGCHIHFPDSNRGNSVQEKSNQVSIAGQPLGVETARSQIRELLPVVFMFELPVTGVLQPLPDSNSPGIQKLQQQYNITISFRQRPRMYVTTVIVRGSVYNAKSVKEGTMKLMEHLTGNSGATVAVSMQLEIAPQHHLFIIGRSGMNIKQIMQRTGASIHFPDPNTATPQRKGTVYITGSIESVFLARQHLIGCLPLVLMFDVKDEIEMDQSRITQLMEQLDVFISVKPKPKQPSKSVIVKSIERNAPNMYLARLTLLGLKKDDKNFPPSCVKTESILSPNNGMGLPALSFFGQNYLAVNTNSERLLMMNGNPSPNSVGGSPQAHSPHCSSPSQWIQTSQGIYAPMVVIKPAISCSVPNQIEARNQSNDLNQSATRVPVQTSHAPTNTESEHNSPSRSPCDSPKSLGRSQSAVELTALQQQKPFDKVVGGVVSPSSSAHTLDLLGLSKTVTSAPNLFLNNSGRHSLESSLNRSQYTMNSDPRDTVTDKDTPEMVGSVELQNLQNLQNFQNDVQNLQSLQNLQNEMQNLQNMDIQSLQNMQKDYIQGLQELQNVDLRNLQNQASLFTNPYALLEDYEQKKLMATKAMQRKPEGETRNPTDIWSGMGFSKSMPESAIRERMQRIQGVLRHCEPPMETTYENPNESEDGDRDPWHDPNTGVIGNKPMNPAPGEYPSPRKKHDYNDYLSSSNHVDSATLPPVKGFWHNSQTDLPELFSKLGLGKYSDLFRQQEIDLATFLTLTETDLRELGISTFGARRKMLLAIADLNKRKNLLNVEVVDNSLSDERRDLMNGATPSDFSENGTIATIDSVSPSAPGNHFPDNSNHSVLEQLEMAASLQNNPFGDKSSLRHSGLLSQSGNFHHGGRLSHSARLSQSLSHSASLHHSAHLMRGMGLSQSGHFNHSTTGSPFQEKTVKAPPGFPPRKVSLNSSAGGNLFAESGASGLSSHHLNTNLSFNSEGAPGVPTSIQNTRSDMASLSGRW